MTSPGAHKQMTMLCNRDDSYPQQALTWPDMLSVPNIVFLLQTLQLQGQ